MNWITDLILWSCTLPVLPIVYFMMRNEVKFKKNIVVGVTLPYMAREDLEVKRRLERYKRELGWICLLLLLVAIPCFFIESFNAAMFAWGMWIILMIVLPDLPYIRCNRDLKAIKHAKGWSRQSRDMLRVDTAAIPKGKWLSPWLFAPAVLLCLLPIVWDRDLLIVHIVDAVCSLGCWAGYRYLYRNRAETVDANWQLTQVLNHVRRRNWGKVWLYCAYFLAGADLAMWLLIDQPVLSLALILLLSALVVCAAVRIEFLTRRVQEKLTAQSGKAWYADEDDKWIWGLFYYDPNDSRTMINARVGISTTVNLAKPAGKVLMILVALLLLVMPFTGFMIDGIGSKPIDLGVSEGILTASYGSSRYEVEIEDIEMAELLDLLPEGLHRVNGIGAEDLLKGRFRAADIGSITLCLDPQCSPFILIKTNSGQHYLFGTRDRAITEGIFAEIENQALFDNCQYDQ